MANPIHITVGGMHYSVVCDQDEVYAKSLVNELEHRMDRLSKEKPFLSTTMVAVMVALDALDNARQTAAENENLRLELKRLMENATRNKYDGEVNG